MNAQENFNNISNLKEKYLSKVDSEGYLSVASFAVAELGRQSKSVASLLDGEEGTSPEYNLGEGLRYKGASGNYSDMKIHIDDLENFIERVKNHYK
jgi:hypothetical protein